MNKTIPQEISCRLQFEKGEMNKHTPRVKGITPIEPCEHCGKSLLTTRVTRIARAQDPFVHWREFCYTCKLVCVHRSNDWKSCHELNRELRSAKYQDLHRKKVRR